MQLRVIIPKLQPVKLPLGCALLHRTVGGAVFSQFTLFSSPQPLTRRKTLSWRAVRYDSMVKGRRSANLGQYIPVYSFKH